MNPPFSKQARWIWDASDRRGYHEYRRFSRRFSVQKGEGARLLITADALYQAWINGEPVGHGPAKSAAGRRSVDGYQIAPFLREGENVLEVLVLSLGVGTMTYCLGDAGLIFEIRLGSEVIPSDGRCLVRREETRRRPTLRRWILPCVEDVDATAEEEAWAPALVVPGGADLYARRVPLPVREPVYPSRQAGENRVELPNFQAGFRIKPALVGPEEAVAHETFATPATFRLGLVSPVAQTLRFTPTLGSVEWSFAGKRVFIGSGWRLWSGEEGNGTIHLSAGRNELTGAHLPNHFEHISLAGFTREPVEVEPLLVERADGVSASVEPLLFSNPHDLAVGAECREAGEVRRTLWDLGAVYNGWIAFEAEGGEGTALLLSFFEAMEGTRIQWPDGCNNALLYRLRAGRQKFESFFPYGVRYIALHEIGGEARVSDLRLLKATCCRPRRGFLHTGDELIDGIYASSAQCVESGTDDTLTDCPTFEQVNWNFDNRLASMADLRIGWNTEIIRNSILLFAEDPFRTGLVASQTPGAWRNRPIPLWSFAWILWCWDYYWLTGDADLVRAVFPAVEEGIAEALARIGPKGLMEWPGVWHFVEWGHGRDDDHPINTAEQAGLVAALEAAQRLARVVGSSWDRSEARTKLIQAINRHLWEPACNGYADSLHADGLRSPVASRLTNAMVALYGIGSPQWSENLAHSLAGEGAPFLPAGSPYGFYSMLELFDRYRLVDAIFQQIKGRWGDMVRAGDRTTWETFAEYGHGAWPTRSRCHPFSAYVVKYFTKYCLGIEALEPGFASVKIHPNPPAGLAFSRGAVPTPHGMIEVAWERKAGQAASLDFELPQGVRVQSSGFREEIGLIPSPV